MPSWLVIADGIFLVVLIYLLSKYASELWFYRKNNCDYSITNPNGLPMWFGYMGPKTDENRMSNYDRIWYGYPLFILILGGLFGGFSSTIYDIQSCIYADLKKCGIEVKDVGVSVSAAPSNQK